MFKPQARPVLPVLVLTAALALLSAADASAGRERAPRQVSATSISMMTMVKAYIVTLWDSLAPMWGEAGPRMDDNG